MVVVGRLAAVGERRRSKDIEGRHNGDGVREDWIDATADRHGPHHASQADARSRQPGPRLVCAEGIRSIDDIICFS